MSTMETQVGNPGMKWAVVRRDDGGMETVAGFRRQGDAARFTGRGERVVAARKAPAIWGGTLRSTPAGHVASRPSRAIGIW